MDRLTDAERFRGIFRIAHPDVRRFVQRRAPIHQAELVALDEADLVMAATSRWGLRTADAIHLATAIRLKVDCIITHDDELGEAAVHAGLDWLRP